VKTIYSLKKTMVITMTLLEYLLIHYIGEPTRIVGKGESYFDCPQCGSDSFHTLPNKPLFKHRAKCWSCDFRGDEADMLKEFHPDETWQDRRQRMEQLFRDWRKAYPKAQHGKANPERNGKRCDVPSSNITGDRGHCAWQRECDRAERVGAAVAELINGLHQHEPKQGRVGKGLWALTLAASIAQEHGVRLEEVAAMGADLTICVKALHSANPEEELSRWLF